MNMGMLVRLLYYLSIGIHADPTGSKDNINPSSGILNPPLNLNNLTKEEKAIELERLDLIRHKQVAIKAVSSILILLLKSAKLHRKLYK